MIPVAALSGPLPKAGIVVAALVVAVALVHPGARARALAMLGALVLAPALLLADIWHSPQLSVVHRHPAEAAAIAVVGLVVVAGLAVLVWRRPPLLALLVLVAIPFRIPIAAGGTTANLLVPLYLVVGAGALAVIVPALCGRGAADAAPSGDGVLAPEPTGGWVERLLALYIVLYAVQAIYSPDFEKALQQMVFFYVPFALLFCLLRRLRWTPVLLRRCLIVIVGLALVLAAVGFVEYGTKTLFLNPKLIAENNVHTYFAINSVFFDADIFGRFLALVMILLAAALLYSRRRRTQLEATGALAVAVGRAGAHPVSLEPRGAAGRARDPRRDALEGEADPVRSGCRRDRRRRRGGRLAEHVRTQPGAERSLERAGRPRQRWGAAVR